MKACFAVLALAMGATAFTPAPVGPTARTAVRMAAENQGRREFGAAFLSSLAVAGAAGSANAVAGDSPKFSLFGLVGNGDSYSEGAAYGSDQALPSYSAYSPYQPASADSLATGADYTAELKKTVLESEKRLKTSIPPKIQKKQWIDIAAELTRQLYSLRNAMNRLATTDKATAAAKQFYVDIEELDIACKRKNQERALKAYDKTLASLAAYKSIVGL